jgi:hypothetical protein
MTEAELPQQFAVFLVRSSRMVGVLQRQSIAMIGPNPRQPSPPHESLQNLRPAWRKPGPFVRNAAIRNALPRCFIASI